MIASTLIGLLPHHLLAGLPAGLRLLVTIGVIVGAAALLLSYTQGLSLRTAMRALKGDPTADLSSPHLRVSQIDAG